MAGCGTHHHGQPGCTDCRAAWRHYEKQRRTRIRDGAWLPRVEPGQVIRHVAWLGEQGMSLNAIAEAAGANKRTLQHLGRRRWLTGALAAAVLAVQPADRVRGGHVPTVRAARRVQALVALGWSFTEQARVLGVANSTVWEIAHEKHTHVSEPVYGRVVAMFERLSGSPGLSARARSLARRYGWLPPLGWDDIDAGRAAVEPEPDGGDVDELAVERALSGDRIRLTDAELLAAARTAEARGWKPWQVAEALRMNVFSVRKLMAGELPVRRAKAAARRAS